MEDLARIQAQFLKGVELIVTAFNALLAYQKPPTTTLGPTLGPVVPKPGAEG